MLAKDKARDAKNKAIQDQIYWDIQAEDRKQTHSVYLAGGGNQAPHDVREQNGDMYDVRCTFYDNLRSEDEKEVNKGPENQACPPEIELEKDQDQEGDQENQDQEMDLQLLYQTHDTKEPEKSKKGDQKRKTRLEEEAEERYFDDKRRESKNIPEERWCKCRYCKKQRVKEGNMKKSTSTQMRRDFACTNT